MSFQRREPREHITAGFAFEKPVRASKPAKPLRPRQSAPGEPRKKYSTLERDKPIERTWMKRNPIPLRVFRETPAEREHKRVIRQARVCAIRKYTFAGPCRGKLDVAHLGPSGGMGRKHGDWTQTALICRSHHRQIDGHQRPSVFDGMSPDQLRELKEYEIHLAREFVAGRRTVSA